MGFCRPRIILQHPSVLFIAQVNTLSTFTIYLNVIPFLYQIRSLYLIAFDVTADPKEWKIDYWLHSVRARAKSASVIIVGTHSDSKGFTEEREAQLLEQFTQLYLEQYSNVKVIQQWSLILRNLVEIFSFLKIGSILCQFCSLHRIRISTECNHSGTG